MLKPLTPVIVFASLCAGCVHFPYGQSHDKHNFTSTPHMPLSVAVVDTISGETVWKMDVPINKKLVIDFDHKQQWTSDQGVHMPATRVRWQVFDPDEKLGLLWNDQELTGNPVVMKVSIREKGEPYEVINDDGVEEKRFGVDYLGKDNQDWERSGLDKQETEEEETDEEEDEDETRS